MSRSPTRIPKLRHHKASGNAAVMLNGRFLYLGRFGSAEAQERYDRLVGEWLSNRRQTPPSLCGVFESGCDATGCVRHCDYTEGRN